MDEKTEVEEVESVSMTEFGDWIVEMIEDFIDMMENVSSPFFITVFGISAFVLVLGIVLGSNKLRGAGGGGLIFSIIAFLIIRNADTVVGILESFSQNAP